jgi:hypothetical protein
MSFFKPLPGEVPIMLRAFGVATIMVMLSLGSAATAAPGEEGGNAALKYWQAIATLPKLKEADAKKFTEQYLTMPLDAQAKEVVGKAEYALKLMKQGTALKHCDWGIPYADGINILLPQLDGVRLLTSLASLRARLRLEAGATAEALDDILAAMALGRHVSQGGILIETLFGYSLENRASENLATILPKLDAKTIKELKTRLSALPPAGTPAQAMVNEELSCIDWLIREVNNTKDKEGLLNLVQPFFISEGQSKSGELSEKAKAFLEESGGTKEGVIKAAEDTRSSYKLLTKKMDLPPEEFQKEFDLESKRQANNPVFKTLFPAINKVVRAKVQADVRRALLAAALDVQLDGRDALKNHVDPGVGGTFEYVPFKGGFELRSKFKGRDDKPVMLTIGSREK